jgi:NADH-quinone oxidoreductase subunit E
MIYKKFLEKYEPRKDNLIYILHDIQDNHPQNYIPEDAIEELAEYLKISPAHIHGVLTFYTMYSTKPRGKNVIRLCESPPCFLRGSEDILKHLKKILQVKIGETTADGMFTLELCACLGVCGNAPVMMINEDMYGDLTITKVDAIIKRILGGE